VAEGRLGCPLCLQLSARIDGPAGDDAVTGKCDRCGVPFILPATAWVIERVRVMYAAVPEALGPAPQGAAGEAVPAPAVTACRPGYQIITSEGATIASTVTLARLPSARPGHFAWEGQGWVRPPAECSGRPDPTYLLVMG
jgi:hypothetical protein